MSSLTSKTIRASFWVIFGFGAAQIIRLGGNLILTRLLAPELFGVMAIVWVVLNGAVMLSDFGLVPAVVRSKISSPSRFHDTVWTLKVIRGWFLFFCINIFAVFIYYEQSIGLVGENSVYAFQELPLILLSISFIPLIESYGTLAIAIQTKNLEHKKLELIELFSQLLGMTLMITLAYIYSTIWALVVGSILTTTIYLFLTYRLFSIRHNLLIDKQHISEIYHFGKWVFIASSLTFFAQQGDKLYFSSIITPTELGIYSIAFMIISVFRTVLDTFATKVWYPYFCNKIETESSLKETYYNVKIFNQISVFIVALILYKIGQPLIDFLYDERYSSAGTMIRILVISLMAISITSVTRVCLTALGETKVQVQSMLVRSSILVVTLPLSFYHFGLLGAILAYALNVYFMIPVQLIRIYRVNLISYKHEALSILINIVFMVTLYFLEPKFWLAIVNS